jgi:protein-S-isoprenylcysteine O-methyltransferase Ste14
MKDSTLKQVFVFFQFLCIGILAFVSPVFRLDVGLLVQIAAIAFGIWAVLSVGQNNWSVYPVPNESSSISAKGAYQFVRHPMYTSILFFFLPQEIRVNFWGNWVVYAILVITLVLKIRFEEKQILMKHPEYEVFKKQTTKHLVPWVW